MLVLIAIVVAVLLVLVALRGYCPDRSWSDWSAGIPCPAQYSGSSSPVDQEGWLSSAKSKCDTKLAGYGSDIVSIEPGKTHVRDYWYAGQSPRIRFFVALKSPESRWSSPFRVFVRPWSEILGSGDAACREERVPSDTSDSGAPPEGQIWHYACTIQNPERGYASGGFGGNSGTYYRVVIHYEGAQNSDLTANYCWYAYCDVKFPGNNGCPDPRNSDDHPYGGYPSSGYPSSGYPSSGYPSSSPPGYPTQSYPGASSGQPNYQPARPPVGGGTGSGG